MLHVLHMLHVVAHCYICYTSHAPNVTATYAQHGTQKFMLVQLLHQGSFHAVITSLITAVGVLLQSPEPALPTLLLHVSACCDEPLLVDCGCSYESTEPAVKLGILAVSGMFGIVLACFHTSDNPLGFLCVPCVCFESVYTSPVHGDWGIGGKQTLEFLHLCGSGTQGVDIHAEKERDTSLHCRLTCFSDCWLWFRLEVLPCDLPADMHDAVAGCPELAASSLAVIDEAAILRGYTHSSPNLPCTSSVFKDVGVQIRLSIFQHGLGRAV